MVRRLGMLLLLPLLLIGQIKGQNSQTVYQNLFTSSASTPATSSNVSNIGQTFHIATLVFSNRSPSTCTSPDPDTLNPLTASFEYSVDGTNYYPFGQPLVNNVGNNQPAPNTLVRTYIANGVYPIVRFKVTSYSTNCRVTGSYTGSVQSNLISPATTCVSGVGRVYSTGFPSAVIQANPYTDKAYKICSITAYSSSSTPVIVGINQGDSACTSTANTVWATSLATNANYAFGSGVGIIAPSLPRVNHYV